MLFLKFDQIQPICSPYILLQTIIEESSHSNLRKSIFIVLQRYQIAHIHLQQLIEQFFPKNTDEINEKDEELCYLPSVLEEAYEDKLQFDDEQIYHHVKKRNSYLEILKKSFAM